MYRCQKKVVFPLPSHLRLAPPSSPPHLPPTSHLPLPPLPLISLPPPTCPSLLSPSSPSHLPLAPPSFPPHLPPTSDLPQTSPLSSLPLFAHSPPPPHFPFYLLISEIVGCGRRTGLERCDSFSSARSIVTSNNNSSPPLSMKSFSVSYQCQISMFYNL